MTKDKYHFPILLIIGLSLLFVVGIFSFDLMKKGERNAGNVESIDGVPYPSIDNVVHVEEKLAHADVYLKESVFAKVLDIDVVFEPIHINELYVGVRRDSFWLSYDKVPLYSGVDGGKYTQRISIPLTDKFQDTDRSIDIMFFAYDENSSMKEDDGIYDTTHWALHSLTASVRPIVPAREEVRNYVRSIITKERAQ